PRNRHRVRSRPDAESRKLRGRGTKKKTHHPIATSPNPPIPSPARATMAVTPFLKEPAMGARGRIVMALVACCLTAGLWAQEPTEKPAEKPAETPEKKIIELPGLRLDREKRVLDVEATVIRREGDWLELLACTP